MLVKVSETVLAQLGNQVGETLANQVVTVVPGQLLSVRTDEGLLHTVSVDHLEGKVKTSTQGVAAESVM